MTANMLAFARTLTDHQLHASIVANRGRDRAAVAIAERVLIERLTSTINERQAK